MSKPIVAVVGRPNVGKSTLFNSLCGQQISIVKDTPGVTRDRIYAEVSWLSHNFTLIDTGGIEPDTGDIILSQMREQAEIAIETADVIIFMTDVKQGLVDSDSKVADMLRRSHKPVILVVNKVDSFEKMMPDVYEFYNLGIGEPFPISAVNKLGFGEVLDEVVSHFPEGSDTEEEDDRPKVAIIGKPNVGKSSIINKLVGKNRVIVSDIAGTTRDAIDTAIKYNGKEYVFIDTAGLRRKSKIKEDLERFSIIRTVAAVERADIAILVIDATEGVTEQDAKIAGIAHERGKGIIIAVNKWDDVEKDDKTIYEFTNKIKDTDIDADSVSLARKYFPYKDICELINEDGKHYAKLIASFNENKYEDIDDMISKIKSSLNELNKVINSYGENGLKNDYHLPKEFESVVDSFESLMKKLKNVEKEKLKIYEDKQKVVANLSHDLKTPLTVVRGYSKAFLDGVVPKLKEKQYLETIYKKSIVATDAIDSLFMYAKFNHPEYSLNMENVDIVEFTKNYLAEKYSEIENNKMQLDIDIKIDKLNVNIDTKAFRRIYENLINNSIKYNKNGTTIYFKMWKSKDLFISVGDNGIGIDKSIKDNIFEVFVTSNSARTSGNGTGLGLSIVKSLVEMHGGEIILVDKPKNGMKTEFLIKIKI